MNQTEVKCIVFDPQRLREARESKFPELSARAVAIEHLNISPQRLSRYEQGLDYPQPTMLAQMCKLYGVELLELTTEAVAA